MDACCSFFCALSSAKFRSCLIRSLPALLLASPIVLYSARLCHPFYLRGGAGGEIPQLLAALSPQNSQNFSEHADRNLGRRISPDVDPDRRVNGPRLLRHALCSRNSSKTCSHFSPTSDHSYVACACCSQCAGRAPRDPTHDSGSRARSLHPPAIAGRDEFRRRHGDRVPAAAGGIARAVPRDLRSRDKQSAIDCQPRDGLRAMTSADEKERLLAPVAARSKSSLPRRRSRRKIRARLRAMGKS